MILKLYNNLTKKEETFTEIEDKLTSQLFYHIDLTLVDGMIDGEYTYELYDEDILVAQGLMQIGDYERDIEENKEYNDNKKTYIVYGE